MTDNSKEIDVTARTIWAEDRSGGIEGMSAVADVLANRVAVARIYLEQHGKPHPLFGNGTFTDCCLRPWQFSSWNANDPNRAKLLAVTISDASFSDAMKIAEQAVNGTLLDSTKGATYYLSKDLDEWPDWAEGLTPCADIGGQVFFNNVH